MSSTNKPLFKIRLDKTTYYKSLEESSGIIIRGSLLFNPTFTMKVNRITLRFQGKYVAISTKDIRKSEKVLIENQWVFFDAGKKSQTMQVGSYKYDFEMALPEELPESCKLEFGSVHYKFKATVDTSMLFSNLKDEREVFLRQNVNSLLDSVYPNEITRNWRNLLKIRMTIPSNQYKRGSTLPISFQTQSVDESVRVNLISCSLHEHLIFRSPKVYRSSRPVIRDQTRAMGMTFTWCKNLNSSEDTSMKIKIPDERCAYDCVNEYFEISHKLRIRVDIEKEGLVESLRICFPILIVPQISTELSYDELDIEQLPGYEVIPPPPSYDLLTCEAYEQTSLPPRYSSHFSNIYVY
ncbi:hypothetical protein K493DRAFT_317814 [Basidiobolus meristosporus CBS 931.73]|uniref:Arrestin C-terminal-like domain-containing protein n=1 Tax=Basidiobolus meristosporus CBS 931.73 TaxID=1314790 RepID=A0A1Y1XY46_9FUNG|nr:hypothetical protein K493DRAFT_317814 [Basidiobolus meristosporus CBS 931.73]|eukprot:ORX90670.1 hypothetical protein K493DRAFT_317814 [Basidiobolus meristosporus CBS 931.73]